MLQLEEGLCIMLEAKSKSRHNGASFYFKIGASRRATFAENGSGSNADSALAVVAHAVHDRTGKHHITYSSGFSVQIPGTPEGRSVFVSCAHTLEEVSDRLALGVTRSGAC